MTGPEHYREAEHILARLAGSDMIRGDPGETELLAEAQVHATLALAAATAHSTAGHKPYDYGEWREDAS